MAAGNGTSNQPIFAISVELDGTILLRGIVDHLMEWRHHGSHGTSGRDPGRRAVLPHLVGGSARERTMQKAWQKEKPKMQGKGQQA